MKNHLIPVTCRACSGWCADGAFSMAASPSQVGDDASDEARALLLTLLFSSSIGVKLCEASWGAWPYAV